MLKKLNKRMPANGGEGGFTLIELLVVIIIIGILAAIAIPVYLNQRQKAYDSTAQSDLRNMATAMEAYYSDNNDYTGVTETILHDNYGFRPSTAATDSVISAGTAAYCLESNVTGSSAPYYLTSDNSIPTKSACT